MLSTGYESVADKWNQRTMPCAQNRTEKMILGKSGGEGRGEKEGGREGA